MAIRVGLGPAVGVVRWVAHAARVTVIELAECRVRCDGTLELDGRCRPG